MIPPKRRSRCASFSSVSGVIFHFNPQLIRPGNDHPRMQIYRFREPYWCQQVSVQPWHQQIGGYQRPEILLSLRNLGASAANGIN